MARTRSQDYEAKREIILRQSADLFAQFGYAGTSISMIADACGISKALLYHYYSDKEAVLYDVLSTHLERLLGVVEAAQAASSQENRLYELSLALLVAYKDADSHHQVQIANLKLLPADKQEILRNLERRIVEIFRKAIADTLPANGQDPKLKVITMSLFGMLNWHYLWFKDAKGISRADYARLITGLVTFGAPRALSRLSEEKPVFWERKKSTRCR